MTHYVRESMKSGIIGIEWKKGNNIYIIVKIFDICNLKVNINMNVAIFMID